MRLAAKKSQVPPDRPRLEIPADVRPARFVLGRRTGLVSTAIHRYITMRLEGHPGPRLFSLYVPFRSRPGSSRRGSTLYLRLSSSSMVDLPSTIRAITSLTLSNVIKGM